MTPTPLAHRGFRPRGVTLIEATVALLIMSFGMLALVTTMGTLRRSGDVAKQRSEAVRLAQHDLARLRAFSVLEGASSPHAAVADYENDIKADAWPFTLPDSNTTYSITRAVEEWTPGQQTSARAVRVTVSWTDRASKATDPMQTLELTTIVARSDPAFSGALSITPAPGEVRQPRNRHPAIPPSALDLGNKTSAFRPGALASTVWIFNNVTGSITSTCAIAPASPLTVGHVSAAACSNTLGFLLSGTVNFSMASPANPAAPEATALPLGLALVGGSYRAPRRDAATGLALTDGSGNPYIDTLTTAAPAFQCFDDAPGAAPSAQAFVNYSCIVFPSLAARPSWSGSLRLTGLNLGTAPGQYRVCRYSADYNGNGTAFANAEGDLDNYEHPAVYAQVTGPLARQNFLVVRGDIGCPTAPAVDLGAGVFADYSTVQLQP